MQPDVAASKPGSCSQTSLTSWRRARYGSCSRCLGAVGGPESFETCGRRRYSRHAGGESRKRLDEGEVPWPGNLQPAMPDHNTPKPRDGEEASSESESSKDGPVKEVRAEIPGQVREELEDKSRSEEKSSEDKSRSQQKSRDAVAWEHRRRGRTHSRKREKKERKRGRRRRSLPRMAWRRRLWPSGDPWET